ncbi:MAG: hypothetical protein MI924_20930 [Chloroflexales bacterium]|nr:hypothetical protein [Chloroflexales bacterium]
MSRQVAPQAGQALQPGRLASHPVRWCQPHRRQWVRMLNRGPPVQPVPLDRLVLEIAHHAVREHHLMLRGDRRARRRVRATHDGLDRDTGRLVEPGERAKYAPRDVVIGLHLVLQMDQNPSRRAADLRPHDQIGFAPLTARRIVPGFVGEKDAARRVAHGQHRGGQTARATRPSRRSAVV